jgi:flagellar hook-associated protein 3 FlgL
MSDRISSFAGSYALDYQLQSMQSQLSTVTGEIASGMQANPTAALGTNAALLYQLNAQENQETTLQTTITTASNTLDTAQTVLSSIASTAQTVSNAALLASTPGTDPDETYGVLAQQASSAISSVLGQLNTSSAGGSIFAGDSAAAPMRSPDAPDGPMAAIQTTLNNAVASAGGSLTSSNVSTLLDGLSSMFSDSNSTPSLNYTGAFYVGSTDGKPTTVLTGTNQQLQFTAAANQPAFRNLLQGLSMLSMLNAPSSQLDNTAKAALVTQASSLLGTAQNELTDVQGSLGAVQSQLQNAADQQQAVASATQQQIAGYEQTNTDADSTTLSSLQTQIQASYDITSQISQLSLVHYMPSGL